MQSALARQAPGDELEVEALVALNASRAAFENAAVAKN
jgi:hypothetical protein